MSEIFKVYPKHSSYEVGSNGTIKYNGKVIRDQSKTADIFINGAKVSVVSMVAEVHDTKPILKQELPKQEKQPAKWIHGNTGKKRSEQVKQAISKANSKQIIINGIIYNSIREASEQLNVDRSTIHRYNKKALPS